MLKAIDFAKEIKRKKQAIKNTESTNLKKQYQKSIKRGIADLKYYCNQKNISYNEVWAKANCPIYASEQRQFIKRNTNSLLYRRSLKLQRKSDSDR